jgi:hypothetical protein
MTRSNIAEVLSLKTLFFSNATLWKLGLSKLSEEHRPRVLENMVMVKTFVPKRGEGTGDRRRLHNDGLHDLYSSSNIIRVINQEELDGRGMWHV